MGNRFSSVNLLFRSNTAATGTLTSNANINLVGSLGLNRNADTGTVLDNTKQAFQLTTLTSNTLQLATYNGGNGALTGVSFLTDSLGRVTIGGNTQPIRYLSVEGGEISILAQSGTSGFLNVSNTSGGNGNNCTLYIRGLTSNGNASQSLSGVYIDAATTTTASKLRVSASTSDATLSVGSSAVTTIAGVNFGTVLSDSRDANRVAFFQGTVGASVWWGKTSAPQFAIDSFDGGGAGFWTHVSGTWTQRFGVLSGGGFDHLLQRACYDRAWDNRPSISVYNTTDNGPQDEFRIHGLPGNNGGDFSIVVRSDGGYVTGSDRRRKTNIETITNALDKVKQLTGVVYNVMNKDLEIEANLSEANGKKFGLIGQDIIEIIPETVKFYQESDTPLENGWASAYSVDYASIVALLIESVKDLDKEITNIKNKLQVS